MQVSLRSQPPTLWECVDLARAVTAVIELTQQQESRQTAYLPVGVLIITHSACSSVKMLILLLDFQTCEKQDFLCAILTVLYFSGL